jgi:hypothetical protein
MQAAKARTTMRAHGAPATGTFLRKAWAQEQTGVHVIEHRAVTAIFLGAAKCLHTPSRPTYGQASHFGCQINSPRIL